MIAMALGDGTVNINGYLSIRHCEKQEEYLQWKNNLLNKAGIATTGIYSVSNNGYGSYEMRTYNRKFLKLLRRILYTPKKKVTKKIFNRLDATGLAIWYMDDGSISSRKNKEGKVTASVLTISTCTSREENQVMIDILKSKWGVFFGQRKMGNHYALICGTREARKFIKIVENTVIQVDCMKYKLNVKEEPVISGTD